jgi:hypothetical protein
MTPLFIAVQNGHTAVMDRLIAAGADLESKAKVLPFLILADTLVCPAASVSVRGAVPAEGPCAQPSPAACAWAEAVPLPRAGRARAAEPSSA